MSDTKSLLRRISAFRERLEKTPALAPTESAPALSSTAPPALPAAWLSQTLRSLSVAPGNSPAPAPAILLSRARRLVEQARELVAAQRDVSDAPYYVRLTRASDPLVRK